MSEPAPTIGPVADRVRRRLLDQIDAGGYQPGERLAAERELAEELGVSRSTVRQALAALEEAGDVRRVPGRGGGTFVRRRKLDRDLSRVVGVPRLLQAQGMTSGSQVVSTGILPAEGATAEALGLAVGDFVIDVVRIRLADGAPISLEHARLPAGRFPQLLELPLGGSLYELLEHHFHTRPGRCEEHIEVVPAGADEASILTVAPGAPLLSIVRVTQDQDGEPFEYSHDLFRADRTTITVRTPAPRRSSRGDRVVELRPRRAAPGSGFGTES